MSLGDEGDAWLVQEHFPFSHTIRVESRTKNILNMANKIYFTADLHSLTHIYAEPVEAQRPAYHFRKQTFTVMIRPIRPMSIQNRRRAEC